MKTKSLLVAICAVLYLHVTAQVKISGKVVDETTNDVLAGAHVIFNNSLISSVTDVKGSFEVRNIKKGNYEIKVSYLGFKPYSNNLLINADTTVEIKLERQAILGDEVIVVGTRSQFESPTTFKNIQTKEIAALNMGADIPYLLQQHPSVVSTSDAGTNIGYSSIRIRGSDITRINVTVNGIPLNDPESQGVYWVNMPDFISSVDNVQIQRGVGSSSNGAGAFGATINFQTTKVTDKPYAEVNNSFGSFNTSKNTVKFGTGLLQNHWAFDGRLSKIYSDGYIDRAFSDLKSFFTSGSYYGKNDILKFIVFSGKEKTYQAWYGVPQDSLKTNRTFNPYDYKNQTDNYQQDHYQIHYNRAFHSTLNLSSALHYTKGRGYYEEFKADEPFEKYNYPNILIKDTLMTITDLIRQRWLDNDFYGVVASLNYDNHKQHLLTLGGGYNIYDGDHFGDIIQATYMPLNSLPYRYYKNNGIKKDGNIYLKWHYRINNKLTTYADMQYRYVYYSFLGYDNDLRNVQQSVHLPFINPKAGIQYKLNSNNHCYASIAVANKEPNRNDYTESTPASRPRPESLIDFETGYRLSGQKFIVNANLFNMAYKDQLVLTGQINDVGEYTRTNIDKSYRRGVELDAKYLPFNHLTCFGNLALSENKIKNYKEYTDNWDDWTQQISEYKETNIAFSPAVIAGGGISYQPVKWIALLWNSKYVGKQYLDNTANNLKKLDAFFVNDLNFTITLKPIIVEEIEIKANINNVFDEMYCSNGWTYSYIYQNQLIHDNYYYPQAGRHYLFGLVIKF